MNAGFGSSGSFGSRVRLKFIGHNTYTDRRRNFRSKPTPIHRPFHKSELNLSYSRKHVSWLPQAISKILINILSHKVSYGCMMIDPVVNGLNPTEVRRQLHICDHSITTFGKRDYI